MQSEMDSPPVIEKLFTIGSGRDRNEPSPVLNINCVGNTDHRDVVVHRTLYLAMLGCETKDPYGPLTHTAQLFVDMLGMAAIKAYEILGTENDDDDDDSKADTACFRPIRIRIDIYNAQQMEYPRKDRWNTYDGFLIPGSFAAAYNTDPWIETLKQMIQIEIVPHRRKTLGICFGHQVMAHSFSISTKTAIPITNVNANDNDCTGRAVATPSGPRAGRFRMPLTSVGCALLQPSNAMAPNDQDHTTVQLYYTHGDMVETIPNVAVNLGGDSTVPIQSVAYFATSQDADQYRNHVVGTTNMESLRRILPYSVTMQAHPEYSTSMELGVHRTLLQCMEAMEGRRPQRPDTDIRSRDDAIENFPQVQNDSIAMVAKIGRLFGWF